MADGWRPELRRNRGRRIKDFTGASRLPVVHCPMIKRALVALLLSSGTLLAQDANRLDAFDTFGTTEVSLILRTGAASLDSARFPLASSAERWGMAPFGSLPLAQLDAMPSGRPRTRSAIQTDEPVGVAELDLRPRYLLGGEVGFFYGKSSGKYGGEDYAGYISGTLATDKFQLTVGASYQESTYRYPRRWR